MKLISWNVNGLRACMTKGFMDFFNEADADIFCLQETKLQAGQIEMKLPGYEQFWNYAEKKGYSGTAIFTKQKPLSVAYGIGIEEHDHEGRVITLEYPDYYVVTVYTPNSQDGLARLDYRMKWECFTPALLRWGDTVPAVSIDACEAATFSMYIDSQMNCYPCSFGIWDKSISESMNSKTLREIWQGDKFVAFREQRKEKCSSCRQMELCRGGCRLGIDIDMC